MFSVFKNAWNVKDLRSKMLFVLAILAVYRLGTHILLPGIDHNAVEQYKEMASGGQTLYAFISGGGFGTVFALGIGPYISASIIMQLLVVALPPLEQLQKEGEEGRKKISQYTRVLAVILAFVQGIGIVFTLRGMFIHNTNLVYAMATVSLVTGTIFIMWLAELITEKGIGNGSSFIIFANIVAGIPSSVITYVSLMQENPVGASIKGALLLLTYLIIIVFVIIVQGGERRIPVQYAKGGNPIGNTSYMPFKVNLAGVMSIIFAVTLLQFPATLGQFITNDFITKATQFLALDSITGVIIYVILIFVFTFFYTSFAVNPMEIAENMKKNASFIPGVRPGKPTVEYLEKTIYRLSWIGATFYSLIAITPIIVESIFNINVGFGGTTFLIVTGVCLELTKQLESQLTVRQYRGFLS